MTSEIRRFLSFTEMGLFCWEWKGGRDKDGYGLFKRAGDKSARAPRVVWEMIFGAIPDGLCVRHRCDNPGCVNPGHLVLGTNRDNVFDAYNRGRRRGGSGNPAAKLDEAAVAEVIMRIAAGETRTAIAKSLNVSAGTISHIATGRNWRHVSRGNPETDTTKNEA